MSLQARFVAGAIVGLVALAALMFAARATDPTQHAAGLIVAGLGLLFCAFLIKQHYDRVERDPNRPRRPRRVPAETPPQPMRPPEPPPMPALTVGQGLPVAEASRASRIDPQTRTWIRGSIVGVVGLLGLVVAASGSGFAYWGGLLVFAAAVLKIFQMIGAAFDGASAQRGSLPLPRRGERRWVAGAIVGVIAMLALFVARGGGDAYYLGLLVALAAIAYLFFMIKASFDEREQA